MIGPNVQELTEESLAAFHTCSSLNLVGRNAVRRSTVRARSADIEQVPIDRIVSQTEFWGQKVTSAIYSLARLSST